MDPAELAFAGIAAQSEMLRSKEVSSVELVELYLDRIERLDSRLNSFRVVFEERARSAARAADDHALGA